MPEGHTLHRLARELGLDELYEAVPALDGVLIRIKAGPSSNSLAVNHIEICMQAM